MVIVLPNNRYRVFLITEKIPCLSSPNLLATSIVSNRVHLPRIPRELLGINGGEKSQMTPIEQENPPPPPQFPEVSGQKTEIAAAGDKMEREEEDPDGVCCQKDSRKDSY